MPTAKEFTVLLEDRAGTAYAGAEPVTNATLVFFGVAEVGRAVTILEQVAAAASGT